MRSLAVLNRSHMNKSVECRLNVNQRLWKLGLFVGSAFGLLFPPSELYQLTGLKMVRKVTGTAPFTTDKPCGLHKDGYRCSLYRYGKCIRQLCGASLVSPIARCF